MSCKDAPGAVGLGRLALFGLAVLPTTALAHVKWFADQHGDPADPLSLAEWALVCTSVLAGLLALATPWAGIIRDALPSPRRPPSMNGQTIRRIPARSSPDEEGRRHMPSALRTARCMLALSLVACAASGFLLTPHVQMAAWLHPIAGGMQVGIAALLVCGRAPEATATALLLLFAIAGLSEPLFGLEYALYAGWAWLLYRQAHGGPGAGMRLLRASLGLSLAVLAFTEKLLRPDLALQVVGEHSLNFLPLLGVLFLIPALSLAGLPPLSGFWSKFTVIKASLDAGHVVLAATGLLVGLLTLYSMLKIWNEAFWKAAPAGTTETVRGWQTDRRTRLLMLTPIVSLAAITLTIGLFAEPFVDFSLRAGAQLLDKSVYIDAVFGMPAQFAEANP